MSGVMFSQFFVFPPGYNTLKKTFIVGEARPYNQTLRH